MRGDGTLLGRGDKTMFVGVQHPGTGGAGHFPGGGDTMPRSSIIAGTREDGQRIE